MPNTQEMKDTQQARLTRIAASYGTTPERLVAAVDRREALKRDADRQLNARKPVVRKRLRLGFHIGESTGGFRRS